MELKIYSWKPVLVSAVLETGHSDNITCFERGSFSYGKVSAVRDTWSITSAACSTSLTQHHLLGCTKFSNRFTFEYFVVVSCFAAADVYELCLGVGSDIVTMALHFSIGI